MDQWSRALTLFLCRTRIHFSALVWQVTTICNSNFMGCKGLFWPLCVPGMNLVQTCVQEKYPLIIMITRTTIKPVMLRCPWGSPVEVETLWGTFQASLFYSAQQGHKIVHTTFVTKRSSRSYFFQNLCTRNPVCILCQSMSCLPLSPAICAAHPRVFPLFILCVCWVASFLLQEVFFSITGMGRNGTRTGGREQSQKKNQQKQNSDRVVSCVPDIRDCKTFLMATHMEKVSPCSHSPLDFSSSPSGFLSFLAKRNVFLSFFEIILILF